ncbi:hypothetical protein K6025_02740 [Ehrlichia sp. JZT12]
MALDVSPIVMMILDFILSVSIFCFYKFMTDQFTIERLHKDDTKIFMLQILDNQQFVLQDRFFYFL